MYGKLSLLLMLFSRSLRFSMNVSGIGLDHVQELAEKNLVETVTQRGSQLVRMRSMCGRSRSCRTRDRLACTCLACCDPRAYVGLGGAACAYPDAQESGSKTFLGLLT